MVKSPNVSIRYLDFFFFFFLVEGGGGGGRGGCLHVVAHILMNAQVWCGAGPDHCLQIELATHTGQSKWYKMVKVNGAYKSDRYGKIGVTVCV